jgi:hypothetical protein
MDNDELSIGWQEYWINYKKQNNILSRVEDYLMKETKQPVIAHKTLETQYDTNKLQAPNTISIKKERKTIHIKL